MQILLVPQQYGICIINEMYWTVGHKFNSVCNHRQRPWKMYIYCYQKDGIRNDLRLRSEYLYLSYQKLYIVGYRPPDTDNLSLEVRKIPKEFNNIMAINQHFSKFGNLTNIQVCWTLKPKKKQSYLRKCVISNSILENYCRFLLFKWLLSMNF